MITINNLEQDFDMKIKTLVPIAEAERTQNKKTKTKKLWLIFYVNRLGLLMNLAMFTPLLSFALLIENLPHNFCS